VEQKKLRNPNFPDLTRIIGPPHFEQSWISTVLDGGAGTFP
jgi:hypothetical protein